MLATPPVDVASLACEMRPYTTTLYADAERKRPVSLPAASTIRKCADPAEGSQVLTKPDSGGTEMCVFYEFGVDAKVPDVQSLPRQMGVAKALADKACPAINPAHQAYPGKDWFFLSQDVTLPNAFKVKEKIEKEGLAYLRAQKALPADAGKDPAAQLNLYGIAEAKAIECRKNATMFQGRYAACYKAQAYGPSLGRGWTFVVALTKKGEYQFIDSSRVAAPHAPTVAPVK